MQVTDLYEKAPYDPNDPNPWLALYLDMSLPLSDEVKAGLLTNAGSKSRGASGQRRCFQSRS